MRRALALALLVLLVGLTWGRSGGKPRDPVLRIVPVPLALGDPGKAAHHLGRFRLEGAWQLASRSAGFGGYSTLLAMPDGMLLAFGDGGTFLRFAPPGHRLRTSTGGDLLQGYPMAKTGRDVESATRDSRTGQVWLGLEGANAVIGLGADLRPIHRRQPAAISGWGENSGAEAMARLADGRFVLLREAFIGWTESRRHDAVVFAGDPALGETSGPQPYHFVFEGAAGFSPTDMTQLPDGRLLILMRRLVWPMPQRFAGRLAIADPAEISPGGVWKASTVARIASSLPVDNFEGIAVVPGPGGRLTVWIISDDNFSSFQRTVLWKLSVDPRRLR